MITNKNYILNEHNIIVDNAGYLYNYKDWNKNIAKILADQEHIILTPEHWEIINFIRNFYLKFNTTPSMKMLSKCIQIKFGKKKSTSIYLYKLFPLGPAQQGSKIAGIPKPDHCF
ncbi:Sulfurtransferase TusE [Buchnera aphidicola (Eriosoma lanigerum)]|uniref:TusE/DsrC/DsvC family sulfur relay protein n=1 Tax=Buchnera aphidicola TaxID=9 RepID=UPI003463D02E